MIRLIGTHGCSRCIVKKNEFLKKQIEFSYELLENLPEEEQEKILELAASNHIYSMPISIDEKGNIIT